MAIDDIIAKLAAVEGLDLTSEEIAELQGVQSPEPATNQDELKSEKAAKARILQEKKALAVKATELEARIDELQSKDLNDFEKSQKDLEKANKALQNRLDKEDLNDK